MAIKILKTNNALVYNPNDPGNIPVIVSVGGYIMGEYSDDIEAGQEFTVRMDDKSEKLVIKNQLYNYIDVFDNGNLFLIPFFVTSRSIDLNERVYTCVKAHKGWAVLQGMGVELL